ncbi:hypothetical protein EWM62_17385 [Mucilaginibacter terrigena]|uniref:Uncharacterized protein n=1 Tax=Mucilaginibacter terrigena TaxID=2492395 RepID=A0A4Q5LHL7_9SPHI|nr:hypothetical protein [Mucilaginibacter terrigena]RYU86923.1 hypothetical protein EWM62_17385 [Mucilaginibacter terrigena]
MKKILFIAALLSIAFNNQLRAQVKAPVKKKVAIAPASRSIDFFNMNGDDAVQVLNDEFKKLKIVLTGLDERPIYDFNFGSNDKIDEIGTEHRLYFSKGLSARVTEFSADKRISKLLFFISDEKQYTEIKKLLGFAAWKILNEGNNDTTYRNGNIFANIVSAEGVEDKKPVMYYSITAEVAKQGDTYSPESSQAFDVSNLALNHKSDDVINQAINFVKKLGYTFFYKSMESHFVDRKTGKRYGSESTAYFSKSLSIQFSVNKLWSVNEIVFRSTDLIAFSKLKKAFNLSAWTYNGTLGNGSINSYTNKNIDCEVDGSAPKIIFTIHPELNDIDTRLKLAPTPTLADLIKLHNSGTEKEVAKNITKTYLNKISYNESLKRYTFDTTASDFYFYFLSPTNTLVQVYLKIPLTTDFTAPFFVNSSDKAYLKSLADEFDASEYTQYYSKVLLENQFRIHDNNVEATRKRVEAERMEQARLSELEIERQNAEKERLKAEKAARLNESLNKINDALRQMIKKP